MQRPSSQLLALLLVGSSLFGCGDAAEEQFFLDPVRDSPRVEAAVQQNPALETPQDPIWQEYWVPVDNPSREGFQSVGLIDRLVAPRPGMAIADIGSGGGYFAFRYARIVGESGFVRATDIDRRMTRKVAYEIAARGVTNVTSIQVPVGQLGLSPASVDLVMFLDVGAFNACAADYNAGYVRQAAEGLRPGGRMLVFNNVDPGDPRSSCTPLSPEQLIALASPSFTLVSQDAVEKLPWRAYALLFERRP